MEQVGNESDEVETLKCELKYLKIYFKFLNFVLFTIVKIKTKYLFIFS